MSFSLLFFPLVAPRFPKTESAAVIHCVVLFVTFGKTRDNDLLQGLLFAINMALRRPTVFQIQPKSGPGGILAGAGFWPYLEKPPAFDRSRSRNPVQP